MAALMGLTLLVLLVQDIPLGFYLRGVETDRIVTSLERDAFVLAGRSAQALATPTAADDAVLTELAQDYRDAGGARVVIVDRAGAPIVTSDDDQSSVSASYASRPEIATALAGRVTSGHRFSDTLQIELLYVAVPVLSGQDVLGAVRLTYPEQVVTDAVNRRIGVLGLVALTTVLLAGIVGYIFSNSITRRLELLRATTEKLANGDLSARADERSGAAEIRSLSVSFNRMAERLDALIEQQRTFASDASHQLRTPLTALRLRLERARELVPVDADAAADRLVSAEAEADRLDAIIEGLLLLSRTESSAAELEVYDLAAIAIERVEHWQPLAQELGIGIRFDGAESATVLAVPTAIEQIVDNYLDNALSVSAEGDEIVVRVTATGDHVSIEVLDDGPGLSDEDASRAFDRFWRAESDNRGNGLGLAIVAQLARASRATVKLERQGGRGLAASAIFEAASTP
jgi:signal transduction histidine kinase